MKASIFPPFSPKSQFSHCDCLACLSSRLEASAKKTSAIVATRTMAIQDPGIHAFFKLIVPTKKCPWPLVGRTTRVG